MKKGIVTSKGLDHIVVRLCDQQGLIHYRRLTGSFPGVRVGDKYEIEDVL